MIEAKGWWYSPKATDRIAHKAGVKHGKAGLDPMPELVIQTRFTNVGPFDPTTNEEHAELDRKSKTSDLAKEFEAGLRQAEKNLTKYPNRWLLRLLFLFLLAVDYAAINELLTGQGMENPHRTIMAMAGACIFFSLAYWASKGTKS
jgi:hypothetical protein